MHRHASTALAPSSSLLGALREGMQGDYAAAILVPKLVAKGQENQSFTESRRWRHRLNHPWNMRCELQVRTNCSGTFAKKPARTCTTATSTLLS
jgi:hypothetical protein